ncbi:barstar family protein [Citromicrobium bathyomarinum]
MTAKPELVIDGSRVWSLESFWDEVSRSLIPGARWGRNLDAFNDILRGGFGTPEGGFVLRWSESETSRAFLGYPETIRQLEIRTDECHPDNIFRVAAQLEDAKQGRGPTVFDWIVEIIREHGEDGEEAESNVQLVLE